MTEQEWLACEDVREMLEWLSNRTWRRLAMWLGRNYERGELRRFCHFANACFERIATATPVRPAHRAMLTNELPVRSPATEEDYAAGPWNEGVRESAELGMEAWAGRWADAAARCVAWRRAYWSGHLDWTEFKRARDLERGVQAALLRCIFGNPFLPTPAVDLNWLESAGQAAEELARTIAATDAYERLPELANLLEQAGCTDAALLDHCRGPNRHARGCWAVELLAGKSGQSKPSVPDKSSEATDPYRGGDLPYKRRPAPEPIASPTPDPASFGITTRLPHIR
jgi:hypothetical protein